MEVEENKNVTILIDKNTKVNMISVMRAQETYKQLINRLVEEKKQLKKQLLMAKNAKVVNYGD